MSIQKNCYSEVFVIRGTIIAKQLYCTSFLESCQTTFSSFIFSNEETVPVGKPARFTAQIGAFPRAVVTWYFNGELIEVTNPHYKQFNEGTYYTLLLLDTTEADSGMYSLKAVNRNGDLESQHKLICKVSLNIRNMKL